jgi:hypothetical protein
LQRAPSPPGAPAATSLRYWLWYSRAIRFAEKRSSKRARIFRPSGRANRFTARTAPSSFSATEMTAKATTRLSPIRRSPASQHPPWRRDRVGDKEKTNQRLDHPAGIVAAHIPGDAVSSHATDAARTLSDGHHQGIARERRRADAKAKPRLVPDGSSSDALASRLRRLAFASDSWAPCHELLGIKHCPTRIPFATSRSNEDFTDQSSMLDAGAEIPHNVSA